MLPAVFVDPAGCGSSAIKNTAMEAAMTVDLAHLALDLHNVLAIVFDEKFQALLIGSCVSWVSCHNLAHLSRRFDVREISLRAEW